MSEKKDKNLIKSISSIVLVSVLFLIALLMIITYIFPLDFSLFIGIGVCIVGLITAHKSVIAEMEFKKYSGPDVMGGIALMILGVTVMSQAMLTVIFICYPILSGILGLWFLIDWFLSLVVKKKQRTITLILGVIFATVSTYLLVNMNFGIINILFTGITLLVYAGFMLYKEFFTKDVDIKVEKVQEDYE